MFPVVIQTHPNRRTRSYRTTAVKYAQVQPSGKFRWVLNPEDATIVRSAQELCKILGVRARKLRYEPTSDVTFAPVEELPPVRSRVRVGAPANGHRGI